MARNRNRHVINTPASIRPLPIGFFTTVQEWDAFLVALPWPRVVQVTKDQLVVRVPTYQELVEKFERH